ncbi:hypothetical protein [Mycobacterium simiae]|uniref:hypothetical protein n=1 Tax=Mycobacterium simiae TaxID=1784 RepID=UPI0021CD900C|nr:hypothetical protein [Mycobacterium simiae]
MNARRVVWSRSAVVAVGVVGMIAAVVAQCWLPRVDRQAAHPSHPLLSVVGSEFAVNSGHSHLADDSTLPCPPQHADAVLPRTDTPLLEVAAVASSAGTAAVPSCMAVPEGRGPPPGPVAGGCATDLVIRFRLVRR